MGVAEERRGTSSSARGEEGDSFSSYDPFSSTGDFSALDVRCMDGYEY